MSCQPNEHKYNVHKEIEVPTGKYLVKKGTNADITRYGVIADALHGVEELMTNAYVLVCEKCGDIKVEVVKPVPNSEKEEA